jgi:hypothetical protein
MITVDVSFEDGEWQLPHGMTRNESMEAKWHPGSDKQVRQHDQYRSNFPTNDQS